jgi:hypothetical protein
MTDKANDAMRETLAKAKPQSAANTQRGEATKAPEKPVKHRPETIAKHMADRAAELNGVHSDTPYAAWDEATESQKSWWLDMAKTAHKG